MPSARAFAELLLVNGSIGDPLLFIDYPGKNNALLFDAGENGGLDAQQLGDLRAVFITHHHVDHFIGLDRIVRANLDQDKALQLYGPAGTIHKVADRIRSYEYPFFPFQKIVLQVHEIMPGRLCTGLLECSRHFPEPTITEQDWPGPVVFETPELAVEAVLVDHTVPCLAFALVEKPGYHVDPAPLADGFLRPGDWIDEVRRLLHEGAPMETPLMIQGGQFVLAGLVEKFFAVSPGARVAYVTDTAWSEAVRPGLIQLARNAWRLYCDSYYAEAQARQAAQHRHMTAPAAGELARLAQVEQLVLMHFASRYAGHYDVLLDETRRVFPHVTGAIPGMRL